VTSPILPPSILLQSIEERPEKIRDKSLFPNERARELRRTDVGPRDVVGHQAQAAVQVSTVASIEEGADYLFVLGKTHFTPPDVSITSPSAR
jgi:hypothetical protein